MQLVRELTGTMDAFKATQGLLVCWNGFTREAQREAREQRHKIRLWDQDSLLDGVFASYDRLPAEMKAELALKRTWVLVRDDIDG